MSPFAAALAADPTESNLTRPLGNYDLPREYTLPPLPSSLPSALASAATAPLLRPVPPQPAAATLIDLRFHLTSGTTVRFRQPGEGERAQALLYLLNPDRVFTHPHTWKLADQARMTMIPSGDIERIDLLADALPCWRRTGGHEEDEVQQGLETNLTASALRAGAERSLLHCTAELKSGATIRFQRRLRERGERRDSGEAERTPVDFDLFLSHLLQGPAIFGHGAAGGLFLVNPRHIVRLVTSPGPPETPAGVWPVHFVNEWSE